MTRMSFGRWPFVLLCAWLLLPSAVVSLPSTQGTAPQPSLTLRASRWVLPGRPVEISLEQGGLLAGRRLAVFLFVDQDQFAKITTTSDRTRVAVAMPPLTPGRHQLTAKAGTEIAGTEFRVVPWSWVAGAAVFGLVLAVLALFSRRMRRRSGGLPSR